METPKFDTLKDILDHYRGNLRQYGLNSRNYKIFLENENNKDFQKFLQKIYNEKKYQVKYLLKNKLFN